MSAISLVIDDQKVKVAPGTTILDAARKVGIDIPTFCHDPELAPNGACRICVVEVEKARALVASCVAPVSPGMVVFTDSERVIKARKEILNLLIANHPLVCITCERTGNCKLQDYCYRYGVESSTYEGEVKELSLDDSNDFFIRDMNKCILCGICVGKCQEVVGAGAIDFTGRGFVSNIGPAFEDAIESSTCVFCGLCIESCPVGALTPKHSLRQGRPWQVEKVKTVCPYCSVGCSINLHVKDNDISDVRARKDSPVNRGHLCARGKFGWDYLRNDQRLTSPLVKSNGVFVRVSWEEALELITDNIEEVLKRYGPGALMGLCSPKVSNEESYLLQKLIRLLGSNNIDSFSRHCHSAGVSSLMKVFGSAAMTNSIEEIVHARALLIIEANPLESHPVIGYRIREARSRGAEIIAAGTYQSDLAALAGQFLVIREGGAVAFVNALAKIIVEENLYNKAFIEKRTEGFEAFKKAVTGYSLAQMAGLAGIREDLIRTAARTYAMADGAAIISSAGSGVNTGESKLLLALANLALLTGNLGRESGGFYLPYSENNQQGIADMGVLPGMLCGYQPLQEKAIREKFAAKWDTVISEEPGITAVEALAAGSSSLVEALFILGEDLFTCSEDKQKTAEFLAGLDFLVVQDVFMTETASLADVVLPAATFAEQTGTYTNAERRVQLSQQALQPRGEAYAGWAILAELAGWLGIQWDYDGPEDIFAEIASLTSHYAGISYPRLKEQGLQWPCTSAEHPGTKYLYDGRFSRGLGLFSVVANEPPEKISKNKVAMIKNGQRFHCQCQSEVLSRRSIINKLRKND